MTILTRRRVIVGGVSLVAIAGAAAWQFRAPADLGETAFFAIDNVAIRGTDPVAYFTQNASVAGSADHSYVWSGVTWHFASAENRDKFKDNPDMYAPQYGGYCAWAVGAKNQLYSTQPENWAIVDGKLYLNFNDGVQELWDSDRPGFISKGDDMWPQLRPLQG